MMRRTLPKIVPLFQSRFFDYSLCLIVLSLYSNTCLRRPTTYYCCKQTLTGIWASPICSAYSSERPAIVFWLCCLMCFISGFASTLRFGNTAACQNSALFTFSAYLNPYEYNWHMHTSPIKVFTFLNSIDIVWGHGFPFNHDIIVLIWNSYGSTRFRRL